MFWSGLVSTTSSMEAPRAADPGSARASAMISGFTRRFRGWQVSEAFMIDLLLRNFCARNAEYVQPVRLRCFDMRAVPLFITLTYERALHAIGSPGEIREIP